MADLSHVALRLDDDDEPVRVTETGPLQAAPPQAPPRTGDGVKIVAGSGGVFALSLLIDKAFSSTGMTAADVVEHLGPALGVLYNSSPVVLVLLAFGWIVMGISRRIQETSRRRDRRLQKAFQDFGHAIRTELVRLRADVSGAASAIASVKKEVEDKIDTAVAAAATAATTRAERIEKDIADLRAGQADLKTRVAVVESRDPRLHVVPSVTTLPAAHANLEPVPQPIRRPGRQR